MFRFSKKSTFFLFRSSKAFLSTKHPKFYSPADFPIEPLIITTALTGNVPTKKMNPYVPLTPEEIAADVKECSEAGSVLFHVHSRDSKERPTLDLSCIRKNVSLIKKTNPDVIIQLSTGARAGTNPEDRWNLIRLLPEMGSFCTGSNNLAKILYSNPPEFVMQLAQVFYDTGVKPEIECFDHGHIDNAIFLMNKGIIRYPTHFNFVMGTAGGVGGTVKNVVHMADSIPPGCTFTVCGVGKRQLPLITATIAMGGHVRIGLEDNIFNPDGSPSSNAEQVRKVVTIAQQIGRPIATVEEARRILNLPEGRKDAILDYLDETKELFPVKYHPPYDK